MSQIYDWCVKLEHKLARNVTRSPNIAFIHFISHVRFMQPKQSSFVKSKQSKIPNRSFAARDVNSFILKLSVSLFDKNNSFIMATFKSLNTKKYTKSGPIVTPDLLYWKKLSVSQLNLKGKHILFIALILGSGFVKRVRSHRLYRCESRSSA